ncbi:MAG: hypothetical protein LBF26_03270 [Puniceicoccales bacterium]|jgi:hypothetical protein|nr:hypothetical protein [Puniceicoccales bacterium]
MDVVRMQFQAGLAVLREVSAALQGQNSELMLVIKTPGVSPDVVARSFMEIRMNNLMLSNAAFLVMAKTWGIESVVSLGTTLKLHAESYEVMSEEERKNSWSKVTKQLGVVCEELNGLSRDAVRQKSMREAVETQKMAQLAMAEVDAGRAEVEAKAANARQCVAQAEVVERDLRRKKMGVFKRVGTWLVGES